ncbi:DUF397 domain-containing protein [Actinomadura montaniterrae]|uniref:DUF397 domain-containing protein n=1 Tax=Actinomadura montaniterrae TaxID=1803903 RepID=A0A6L3W1T9_9ACTN|nr:DUF397 domain-containing protein [Actinomadura montaniterrae]KAB2380504.1 DUF397 domain-containing protein [Actinomadura montaniterrae]
MALRSGFASGGAVFPGLARRPERGPRWRKASASGSSGCVEVAGSGAAVLVRDSKDVEGPVVVMTRAAFAGLVAGIRGRVG